MSEDERIRLRPVGIIYTSFVWQDGTPTQPVFTNGTVADLDILDGALLLGIKPYIAAVDSFPNAKAGWSDARQVDRTHADERFEIRGAA